MVNLLNDSSEFLTCKSVAGRCVFIMGHARSSTTITAQLLNALPSVYILGEANFHLENNQENFRERYNKQHISFGNQITKTSYAPNFVPDRDHLWWEWLFEAAKFYNIVGDKMAFSIDHFDRAAPANIQSFFEARFFLSRYVFLLRDPIQALISTSRLTMNVDQAQFLRQTDGWLQYMQMWADWVRVFPNTLTINSDDLTPSNVVEIGNFLGQSMENSSILLKSEMRRTHDIPSHFPVIGEIETGLAEVFSAAQVAIRTPKQLWQAEQKRSISTIDTRGSNTARSICSPEPIGEMWVKANALRQEISELLNLIEENRPTVVNISESFRKR